MSEPIGFLGLGALGAPMAANLVDAGYAVRVWNRTESKADALVARGAQLAATPSDAVSRGGLVASIVWDDAAVEGIVTDEFLDQLGAGGVHVAMSTIAPATARELAARHAAHGSHYVAAPVFGRPEAAKAKQLWVPFSGDAAAKARAKPAIEAMGAQGLFDLGDDVGAATVTKLAGNFLIGAAVRAMQEALSLAEHSGADPKLVVAMLTSTLFDAPIYRSYGKLLAEKQAPPTQSAIGTKDLGLFLQTAAETGSSSPLAERILEMMKA